VLEWKACTQSRQAVVGEKSLLHSKWRAESFESNRLIATARHKRPISEYDLGTMIGLSQRLRFVAILIAQFEII